VEEEGKIMLKRLLPLMCLLWIVDPSASAQTAVGSHIGVYTQTAGRPAHVAVYSEVVSENLCVPDVNVERYEQVAIEALEDSQLARLRIELLERGFDPGFNLDALDAGARLAAAIRMFQAEFSLPVTGQADAATLFMLSVPIQNSSAPGLSEASGADRS
jgi:Putative peptidoglycan binding domain